jgi:SagB-type dehydrogenase family enzyme
VPAAPRLRRAPTLHAYWKDGDLVFENFVTRVAVSADPIIVHILTFFGEWRAPGALADELRDFRPASVARAVRLLVRHTLLVEEGSATAALCASVADTWRDWLPHGSFHFATKDAPFARPAQWARMARAFLAEAPQPPLFKRNPRLPRRTLPPAAFPQDDDFLRVLLARKTHREFSGRPVTLDALASLLRYTWGALGTIDSPNFGPLLHKTSPSGGARHPGEVYVAALNVKGLAQGLYHYSVKDHVLERIRRGPMRQSVLRYTLGQRHVGNACAVCFMTAVFPRSMFKYRSPRAYRIVTLDTGHLAQTFCLVATWLGLAPFTTAAVADTAIERALGIDGVAESIMYVAGVGMPRAATGGRPSGASRPRASADRRRRSR